MASSRVVAVKLFALFALFVACAAAGIAFGAVALSPDAIAGALLHPSTSSLATTVVWDIRLPRVLIGACVGAGLGVAGAMLQMLFRNPLVDPYISGVSAGAALAAAVGFTVGVSFAAIPALAFAGGLSCAFVVAVIGARDGAVGNLRLVLAGVAISALCAAAITLLLLRAGETGGLSVLGWLAGGIGGRGWTELAWVSGYLVVGFAGAALVVNELNALRLGAAAAGGLGLHVDGARWRILSIAALITAACVAVSGVVGFVGLMVPHAMRRLFGGDARRMLPACAVAGAAAVMFADTLARTIAPPSEIPLGVLLAFAGVPFFLAVARRPVDV
ncbi:MAG TPA: iron ABC transporter permease [Casimicrobiaceae bacterium]|jgi:iron complex transport system permease protein